MLIKRRKIGDIYQAIEALAPHVKGAKLGYALAKCRSKLAPEIEALRSAAKPSDEYMKYEHRRIGACEAHAKRGEDGKPLKVRRGLVEEYVFEDQDAFEKTLAVIQEQHGAVIAEQEAKNAEIDELLDGEADVDLHMVSLEQLEAGLPEDMTGLPLLLEALVGTVVSE